MLLVFISSVTYSMLGEYILICQRFCSKCKSLVKCVLRKKDLYIYIYCDESAAFPLIITTPSLIRCPSPGSWPEWGGALKQPGLAASDEAHLNRMAPHHRRCLNAECASPRETGLFPGPCMHAGVFVGPGRERDFRAANDMSRRTRGSDETVPVLRPSGQYAVPTSPVERRGPRGRRSRASDLKEGSACGRPRLPGPFLPEHCPSFTNPTARRGHQIPCLF